MRRDDPASELRARSLRATPQRRAILGAFEGGPEEHLSAEEIHARAASRVPGVGRGTVYATLAELTESGLLSSVGAHDPIRYETNVEPHDHFRCRLCLRLFDVALGAPSTAGLAKRGFEVDRVAIVVEGTCNNCQAYGQGLRDGTAAGQNEQQVSAAALSTLSCTRHETSLGTILVCASADGIARVAFEHHADFQPFLERARSRRGGRAASGRAGRCIESIDAFLGGDHAQAADDVDWSVVGDSARAALESTKLIPWGERRSYHRLGVELAPYDSGYAFGTNPMPLIFPCHRVTRGQQVSQEYVGGGPNREALDRLEHA